MTSGQGFTITEIKHSCFRCRHTWSDADAIKDACGEPIIPPPCPMCGWTAFNQTELSGRASSAISVTERTSMEVDGQELVDASVKEAMRELMAHDGPTPTLTVNILRHWSREKVHRFALHLIGERQTANQGRNETQVEETTMEVEE